MKLLEYEAKALLNTHSIPVPSSTIITRNTDISALKVPAVLKSQVPIGGRGKLGGITIIEDKKDLVSVIDRLLSLNIKGFMPSALLAEEKLVIRHEYYLSLLVDRSSESIRLIAHKNGGIEVESNTTEDFLNVSVNETNIKNRSNELAHYLELEKTLIEPFIANLYAAFIETDATLLEINPLVLTKNGTLVCGDCKMELDDTAAFRHTQWDFEDKPHNANFVTLNKKGNVATIANGAGLAMATVDAVKASGMLPANFLDIGGGATTKSVLAAFEQIQEFPNIQAIIINIFAGITRCDQIAQAVIEAKQHMDSLPPLFIRLAGTNFEEAVALLTAENVPTLGTLEDCLDAAKKVVHE